MREGLLHARCWGRGGWARQWCGFLWVLLLEERLGIGGLKGSARYCEGKLPERSRTDSHRGYCRLGPHPGEKRPCHHRPPAAPCDPPGATPLRVGAREKLKLFITPASQIFPRKAPGKRTGEYFQPLYLSGLPRDAHPPHSTQPSA